VIFPTATVIVVADAFHVEGQAQFVPAVIARDGAEHSVMRSRYFRPWCMLRKSSNARLYWRFRCGSWVLLPSFAPLRVLPPGMAQALAGEGEEA
jgi:hypothetical protein